MILRLGGVDLNSSMNWVDRYQSYQVAQTVNRTVGGRAIVFSTPLRAGRKITLESKQDQGLLQLPAVSSLMSMASQVGAIFTFECGDLLGTIELYNVIFRHNEPPALEQSPLVNRPSHAEEDYFYGKIKLLTV